MKKYILSIMAAMLMASCTSTPTPEEQAKKLITDYIMANANDPKSYEAVSFGTLDSTFSSYYASDRYKELDSIRENLEKRKIVYEMFLNWSNKGNKYLDSIEFCLDKQIEINNKMTSEAENYKGNHFGWKMSHRYRAANGFGAITLGTTTFFFNKEFTEITRTKNEE